jgi:NADPH-dependent FMN reductase
MSVISVIVGSTRQGRFSEKPAQWIFQQLKNRGGVDARLLDLRDFPMPFFDQPMPPAMSGRPPYENEVVKKWTAEIARSDGFIFVTPEYNYGPSAVLKNARLGLSGVEPQGGRLRELWQCHGRSRRSAAPLDSDRASARSGPIVRPYSCRDALGALPRRRCERRTRGA